MSSRDAWDSAEPRKPQAADAPNEYRSNRRRAWVASLLIGLSAVLFASGLLAFGLVNVGLGFTLASQGVDAYRSMGQWAEAWAGELGTIVAIGALVMAVAGIAFLGWLTRSIGNLHALPGPDDRQQSAWAAIPLFVFFPALLGAFLVVTSSYPDSSAFQVALYVAAVASLVNPLITMRRLWAASFPGTPAEPVPAVWHGVWVWWGAFLVGWIALGLAPPLQPESWNTAVHAVIGSVTGGFLEIAAATALAVAAVFIVRIMFRINAMQDAAARTLPTPAPLASSDPGAAPVVDSDPPGVVSPPVRRSAVQWQCDSCEVLNPTALRFCQNCASERG